jgi:ATP-dependent Clp protease, protease subunit
MLVPKVVRSSVRGERRLDVFSRLLSDRIIFLGGPVREATASLVVAQLLLLESRDPEADIMLYIHSPGGVVSAGLAIYDTMQFIQPDVATLCVGRAASVGAFLLTAGAPGKRFALSNSAILIHEPAGQSSGPAGEIEIHAREVLKTRSKIAELMARHTGQSVERILRDTERDRYFSAAEAKQYGIVDEVLTPSG